MKDWAKAIGVETHKFTSNMTGASQLQEVRLKINLSLPRYGFEAEVIALLLYFHGRSIRSSKPSVSVELKLSNKRRNEWTNFFSVN